MLFRVGKINIEEYLALVPLGCAFPLSIPGPPITEGSNESGFGSTLGNVRVSSLNNLSLKVTLQQIHLKHLRKREERWTKHWITIDPLKSSLPFYRSSISFLIATINGHKLAMTNIDADVCTSKLGLPWMVPRQETLMFLASKGPFPVVNILLSNPFYASKTLPCSPPWLPELWPYGSPWS